MALEGLDYLRALVLRQLGRDNEATAQLSANLALVNAGAAVLQALLEGPAYGAALSNLLLKRTSGQVRLGHSNVYAALTALERT